MRIRRLAALLAAGIFVLAGGSVRGQPTSNADEKPASEVCLACHGTEGFSAPAAGGKTRQLHVSADRFGKSKHGAMQCIDCHASITAIPHPQGVDHKVDCGTCHAAEKEQYLTSVHGTEAVAKKNPKAPGCADCHSAHDIISPAEEAGRVAITRNCGSCHKDRFATYGDTYHGQVTTLGYGHTAKCFDCHGSHKIQRVRDPASTVHPDNRLKTCQQCHKGATQGFVTFEPHANVHDFGRYPHMWIASKSMIALLAGVFAFFWAHTVLWFYREYKDRQERNSRPHVMVDQLPQTQGKQVRRFGPVWRIAHLVFALSVMILVLTGMAVFYSETAWAKSIVKLLGGPKSAALIHRISAVTMLGIFFVHLVYLAVHIGANLKTFRWFGPTSLLPRWQDLSDMVGMFKWFFGKGPRPMFDRWTYWEKFDYWAVFWGMAIIGGSGLMLWIPNVVATFLPGWVFNVATLVHGEEAFLAAVFLFTVHFFNNHFRPDKLPPPDIVMFTGAVPVEEFRREHGAEYARLVQTGRLEEYLVDAPSRPMTVGSRILGITLILIGLTLLVLVAIGFAGSLTRL